MKLFKIAAATLFALSSLAANAALISVVDSGSTEYTTGVAIPSNNNFIGNVTATTYTVAGSLQATGKLAVTYYYLGKESNWNNTFSVPGDAEPALGGLNSSLNKGTITTVVEAGDLFNFIFNTVVPATSVNPSYGLSATNAQGATLGAYGRYYSFAVALNATFNGGGPYAEGTHAGFYDAILFLDDTGPNASDDDNHDDLLIGVRVTAIPEPTTLMLLSMGLLGLFGARRLKA